MKPVAGKINNIQALRAFAAISVAYFHTGYSLAGLPSFGSFGVHIFFVISGFIMAGLCQGDTTGFFRRRLIRILPPYWSATIAVFVIALLRPAVLTLTRPSLIDLAKSLFFIPYMKGGQAIQPMLFLGWTLNYEMFFYVALGLSLLCGKRLALFVAGGVVAVTVAVSTVFVESSVAARFYANPIQLEFLIGMATFWCYERVPQRVALRCRGWLLIGVGASGGALIWASVSALEYTLPVFAAASTVLVFSGCLLAKAGVDTQSRSVVALGDASYVLYLIHPYVEYGLDRLLAARHPWLGLRSTSGMIFSLAVTCGLAVLVHFAVERPVVKTLASKLLKKRGEIRSNLEACTRAVERETQAVA